MALDKLPTCTYIINIVETGCLVLLAVKRIVLCELYGSLLGAYILLYIFFVSVQDKHDTVVT